MHLQRGKLPLRCCLEVRFAGLLLWHTGQLHMQQGTDAGVATRQHTRGVWKARGRSACTSGKNKVVKYAGFNAMLDMGDYRRGGRRRGDTICRAGFALSS